MIAGLALAMNSYLPAQLFELASEMSAQGVTCLLVVRGRFAQHHVADSRDHVRLPVCQPLRNLSNVDLRMFSLLHRDHNFFNYYMYNLGFHDATMSDQANPVPEKLDIGEILKLLPHRYPLLLIDRVIELVRAKRVVAIKNVTINEPFFVGHFPGYPIMPGVLIVEAMAQAGAALLFTEVTERDNKLLVFTGIERARFRRPVTPGDQLRIEVVVLAFRGTAGRLQGKAYVEGKLVCEAVVTCRLLTLKPTGAPEAAEPESAGETS
jgi:3-hydroxyacyl-[acyl-carrier-protein] dehydratase